MAIPVTYKTPVSGTIAPVATTPPTQYFESTVRFNKVSAEVQGDAASTSVVVTHNLGLSAAELAADFPDVNFEPIVTGAPSWWVSARATNTVTIGFSATFTNGTTFGVVKVSRPLSSIR